MEQRSSVPLGTLWHSLTQTPIVWGLIASFFLTLLLVSPVGEFPLNDDWIHAVATRHLLHTGTYAGHPYVASTLVAQVFWGALFCKVFGFSFTTLRLSTIVITGIGAWAIAQCGLTIGLPSLLAFLCGWAVVMNPVGLSLTYSYMTDMPFLAMTAVSGLFFLRSFTGHQDRNIILGSLFAAIAFLIRQFGIVLPIAYVLTLIGLRIARNRPLSVSNLLCLGSPWLGVIPIYGYLSTIGANNPTFAALTGRIPVEAIEALCHVPVALCYLSLFFLPLGIAHLWQVIFTNQTRSQTQQQTIRAWGFCLVAIGVFTLPRILFGLKRWLFNDTAQWLRDFPVRMPLLNGDYLHDFAIGNLHLPGLQPTVHLGHWWWLITAICLCTASFVVARCIEIVQNILRQPDNPLPQLPTNGSVPVVNNPAYDSQQLFIGLWGLLLVMIVYNPWRVQVFDRYLLPATIPFILILATEMKPASWRSARWVTIASCVLIYSVSIITLQDYLAWNRAAWAAGQRLMTHYNVPPSIIRNVDTFNGWHNSEQYMQVYRTRSWDDSNLSGKGPWVLDDTYLVTAASQAVMGYEVVERLSYRSWLGHRDRYLTIWKRIQ
ncbi:MAG: hypothetical protein NZ772_08385 [Cyanobacteria bacterium]|nr:hypothetical protein [Cyanobacteriota bacterium]